MFNDLNLQYFLLMSEPNPQIYIRGFPKSTKQSDLSALFQKFGTIKQARIVNAYAFIGFQNQDSVKQAVKEMNDYAFQGSKLKVEIAGKPKKPKGPQPTDQCRYCNKYGHWKNSCPDYRKKSRDGHKRRRRYSYSSSSSSSQKQKKKKRSRRRSPSSQSNDSSNSSSSSSSRSRDKKKKVKNKKIQTSKKEE